jgi:hypothetical protein
VVHGFNNHRDSVDVPESGSIVLGLPDRGKLLKQDHKSEMNATNFF